MDEIRQLLRARGLPEDAIELFASMAGEPRRRPGRPPLHGAAPLYFGRAPVGVREAVADVRAAPVGGALLGAAMEVGQNPAEFAPVLRVEELDAAPARRGISAGERLHEQEAAVRSAGVPLSRTEQAQVARLQKLEEVRRRRERQATIERLKEEEKAARMERARVLAEKRAIRASRDTLPHTREVDEVTYRMMEEAREGIPKAELRFLAPSEAEMARRPGETAAAHKKRLTALEKEKKEYDSKKSKAEELIRKLGEKGGGAGSYTGKIRAVQSKQIEAKKPRAKKDSKHAEKALHAAGVQPEAEEKHPEKKEHHPKKEEKKGKNIDPLVFANLAKMGIQ